MFTLPSRICYFILYNPVWPTLLGLSYVIEISFFHQLLKLIWVLFLHSQTLKCNGWEEKSMGFHPRQHVYNGPPHSQSVFSEIFQYHAQSQGKLNTSLVYCSLKLDSQGAVGFLIRSSLKEHPNLTLKTDPAAWTFLLSKTSCAPLTFSSCGKTLKTETCASNFYVEYTYCFHPPFPFLHRRFLQCGMRELVLPGIGSVES